MKGLLIHALRDCDTNTGDDTDTVEEDCDTDLIIIIQDGNINN